MSKFSFKGIEKAFAGLLAFGKKNKTSIMTGGGVALGWGAVYVFWLESKKAESIIRKKEEAAEGEKEKKLDKKEKALIYAECCWPAFLMGVASSGLSLYSHKLDLDEIAKGYVVTQFFKDKNDEKDKLIEKLKGEVPDKKVKQINDELLEEEYPKDEIMDSLITSRGQGTTLFIDKVTHVKFRGDIVEVTQGIMNTNRILKKRRRLALKKKGNDPFYSSSDLPYKDPYEERDSEDDDQFDNYKDVYSSVGLDIFLDAIGETAEDGIETRMSELLEFRYNGGGDLLKPKDILYYKQYEDPTSGVPAVCFIDYTEFLAPAGELLARNMY